MEKKFDPEGYRMIEAGLKMLDPLQRDPVVITYGMFAAIEEWILGDPEGRHQIMSPIVVNAARHSEAAIKWLEDQAKAGAVVGEDQ